MVQGILLEESQRNQSYFWPKSREVGKGGMAGNLWLSSWLWMGAFLSGLTPPSLCLPPFHGPEANGGSGTGTAHDPLKAEPRLRPSLRGPSGAGEGGRQRRQCWQWAAAQMPRLLLLLGTLPSFRPQMKLQAWKEDASSSWPVPGFFTLPGHPQFLGPHFSFQPQIPSGQRECVLFGEVSCRGGTRAGTRSEEAKFRSPPPSRALSSPS